jgi:hypothetical protein
MQDVEQLTAHKSFDAPDEVREFPRGKGEILMIGGGEVGRYTVQPGWRWSEHVKPIAGTDSCEAPHFQFHLSGTLHVVMDDGTEFDVGPGETSIIQRGHDAWVVGNETCVILDFAGMEHYAERAAGAGRQAGAEPQQPGMH